MSFQDADGARYSGRSQWGQTYQAGGGAAYRPSATSYMGAPAQDFERLYQIVANNIKMINQNVNQIASMVKTMGNPNRDSHDMRIKLRDMIEDTRRLATDTNKCMKDLTHSHTTNPQEDKRRMSKLRNDFQSCLERFQDVSKVAANKSNETFAPKPAKGGLLSNPAPFVDETEDEQHGLMQAQKRQQLLHLEAERDFQSALIEEREEGIKQIESTIQEVNDIFVDLATLVNEQASLVDNIESHIDTTVSNTGRGVVELRKAAQYQESARTKMCCLVVIILAVVAVVVVALVLGISLSLR